MGCQIILPCASTSHSIAVLPLERAEPEAQWKQNALRVGSDRSRGVGRPGCNLAAHPSTTPCAIIRVRTYIFRPRRRGAALAAMLPIVGVWVNRIGKPHSITSSARASTVGAISNPIALAVFRFKTNLNFVGYCTGRSPGFSPRRTRSTYSAVFWKASSNS